MDNELQELLLLLSTLEGVGQLNVAVYNVTAYEVSHYWSDSRVHKK